MKYVIWIIIIAVIVGIVLYTYESGKNSPIQTNEAAKTSYNAPVETQKIDTAATKINISNFNFDPKEVKIKKGTTITWTNNDNAKHSIVSDTGKELNSELFSKGETFSHTFNSTGTFNYHCSPHTNMKGVVIVEE